MAGWTLTPDELYDRQEAHALMCAAEGGPDALLTDWNFPPAPIPPEIEEVDFR
jgi:hypothetical protein